MIVSGAAIYFATRYHPAFWITSVVLGAPIGGSACRQQSRGPEACPSSVVAIGAMLLISWVSTVNAVRQAEWWRMLLLAMPVGFLGGTSIRTAVRQFWPWDEDSERRKH